ncbi:pyridoxine/pyridoxamine 5'-phosphate oxidase [Catellatospora tritici]|uniref:pyridoxine/pyridoxamine 5'-phosphate oxidase n=1 Tax=Catellatospora tritici TaxID=2851566 RepID=UPI001C2D4C1E|nr:pyridoxal 5'-phosphate synthase [Catellatospora tritici]MBV1852837.1 pyridoxal 5'-phosphate synthase [Catellatospora tritici]
MDDLAATIRALPVMAGPQLRFDPATAPGEPTELFRAWFAEAVAQGVAEPQVMHLSTADAAGRPSGRVVLLRDVTAEGWVFTARSTSRKGRELAANPAAALTFYWPGIGRQVRVGGTVQPASPRRSAADSLARPQYARIPDLAGPESEPLADLGELARAYEAARARLDADPDAVAPDHTVYVLAHDEVEFFHGSPDRRHVRLHYWREPAGWSTTLLWP